MKHPAWHKEWNTWAKKRWIEFLCEIPWSWAARELNIRPDFVFEEPGVTVGNLEGVARVKLDTSGESLDPEKCVPGLDNAKPESRRY